jgi:hypothetical protein
MLDANTTPIVRSPSLWPQSALPVIGLIAFNRRRRTFGFGRFALSPRSGFEDVLITVRGAAEAHSGSPHHGMHRSNETSKRLRQMWGKAVALLRYHLSALRGSEKPSHPIGN